MSAGSAENGTGTTPEGRRELLARLLREKAAQGSVLPLSRGQQALWLLHRMAPERASYNVAFTARVLSALDTERLRRSFQALTKRHEMLRSTFALGDIGPVQRIETSVDIEIEEIDARSLSGGELRERLVASCRRPFDLERGPVFRIGHYRRGPTESVLLLTVHHIAIDAISIGLLVREWLTLYGADRDGVSANLDPLPARYGDFVRWQEEVLSGPSGQEMWSYWRGQLRDPIPTLDLPTDRPRPSQPSFLGGTHSFWIDESVAASLRQLAREQETTLFVVLLAAFWTLLFRYAGQADVIVGSPTAGRSRRAFEGLVGYFVNPVVLRGDLTADPTFRTLVDRARQVVLDGLRNGDFPFPTLVERLNPRREAGRSPIFQAEFNLARLDQLRGDSASGGHDVVSAFTLAGLQVEIFPIPQQEGQFDLSLEILDKAGSPHAHLKYATDLFDEGTIRRMAGHLEELLRGIVARPESRLSELPLLKGDERQQIILGWNQTERAYPLDKCLHELIEMQAGRTPESVAVESEAGSLSYRELDSRSNQLARWLRGVEVGPGVRVGIAMERSLEIVVGLLGILKAGGAYVPLDPDYPKDRLAFMLEDAQVGVLLTQRRLLDSLPAHAADVLMLDGSWAEVARESSAPLERVVTSKDLAYVIYTSGSTGKPKAAMNAHRGIVNRLLWMQEAYGLGADDTVLQKTPFSFDVSVWEFFWPLIAGARLVMARPEGHRDPGYLVRTIREKSVTTMHFVPTMLQAFLEEPGVEECTSLRRVICSGEALPAELRDRFFDRLGCELHNLYGPTEAAVDVTAWECRRDDTRRIVPIGRPVANTQVYVLDSRLEPQPIGVPGELYIGGVQVGLGYLGRPELTAERFVPDPFSDEPDARLYRTGDLARFLPDGSVAFLGRIDHQVKIRGFRIELGEIEAALLDHPAVREAVVVVREDRPGDPRLVGYCVADAPEADLEPELRAALRARLPEYMVPSVLLQLEKLPLLGNGKLDRRALPRPDRDLRREDREHVAPRNSTEEAVARIWAGVLGTTTVSIEDNFFDLGGNSMLLLQVVARARREGVELAPLTMFRYPTVRTLAEHLSGGTGKAPTYEGVRDRARRQRQAMARQKKALQRS
jgi:amino acid adenylation domain-containing protein